MNIEKETIQYLKGRITEIGNNVFAEKPVENIPQRYLIVEKTSSSAENFIEFPQVAIKSVSRISKLDAAELNEKVKGEMIFMPQKANIYGCELNRDYDFTDSRTKEYRYQAVFDISRNFL